MRLGSASAVGNRRNVACDLADLAEALVVAAAGRFDELLVAKEWGVTAMDVAKRLLDYGCRAPTTYFPLLVPSAC